jgi:hypothetical protein
MPGEGDVSARLWLALVAASLSGAPCRALIW